MTAAVYSEQSALLRSVVTNPDNDVPRLVYADWLQEHAETDAQRAYAELIRVQCERVKHTPCTACEGAGRLPADHRGGTIECGLCWGKGSPTADVVRMSITEQGYITSFSEAWRRPPCPACAGAGHNDLGPTPSHTKYKTVEVCELCNGTGSRGPLSEFWSISERHDAGLLVGSERFKHTVSWVRGFPVVEVLFEEVGQTYGRENEWLFRETPMNWMIRCVRECGASFKLTGVWCRQVSQKLTGFYPYGEADGGEVPRVIWDEIQGYEPNGWEGKLFASASLAQASLDAAVTRLVVREAYPEPVGDEK